MMAQRERVLVAFVEDLALVSRTHMEDYNHLYLHLQGIHHLLLTFAIIRHAYGAHAYMQAKHSYA